MLEKIVKNLNLTRRNAIKYGLAALAAISLAYSPVKAAGDNTQTTTAEQTIQSPYSPISEDSNIMVYDDLTIKNLTNYLLNPLGTEAIKNAINEYENANIQKLKFGQKPEQLEKLIEWSYIQAATHINENGFPVSYPLNKEQLEKLVKKIGETPIMIQRYAGEPKKEKEKIYLTPIENSAEERNIVYISTGIITEPDSKLKEDPYCDYEVLLESTINPKTGKIERTEILPKKRTTYNTPYNEEGIKELEEWGYDTLFIDTLKKRYIGDGYENAPETKVYIVGCIKEEGDTHKIYFSTPSVWHVHPGDY